MKSNYLFTSPRLGFKAWEESDLPKLIEMNLDAEVMEFFEDVMTAEQSTAFFERMKKGYAESGRCYFPVEELETGEFIGIIGLSLKTFESKWTPNVDIGWRLVQKHWNKGYATEGAKRCLEYGLNDLKLEKIICIAPAINAKSVNVMKKIGMVKAGDFMHPQLITNERLRDCVMFEANQGTNTLSQMDQLKFGSEQASS